MYRRMPKVRSLQLPQKFLIRFWQCEDLRGSTFRDRKGSRYEKCKDHDQDAHEKRLGHPGSDGQCKYASEKNLRPKKMKIIEIDPETGENL